MVYCLCSPPPPSYTQFDNVFVTWQKNCRTEKLNRKTIKLMVFTVREYKKMFIYTHCECLMENCIGGIAQDRLLPARLTGKAYVSYERVV